MQITKIIVATFGLVAAAVETQVRRAPVLYDGWVSLSKTAGPNTNTMGGTLWMDVDVPICSMPYPTNFEKFQKDYDAVIWLNCRDGFYAYIGHKNLGYELALAHQGNDYRAQVISTHISSGLARLYKMMAQTEIESTNPVGMRRVTGDSHLFPGVPAIPGVIARAFRA